MPRWLVTVHEWGAANLPPVVAAGLSRQRFIDADDQEQAFKRMEEDHGKGALIIDAECSARTTRNGRPVAPGEFAHMVREAAPPKYISNADLKPIALALRVFGSRELSRHLSHIVDARDQEQEATDLFIVRAAVARHICERSPEYRAGVSRLLHLIDDDGDVTLCGEMVTDFVRVSDDIEGIVNFEPHGCCPKCITEALAIVNETSHHPAPLGAAIRRIA